MQHSPGPKEGVLRHIVECKTLDAVLRSMSVEMQGSLLVFAPLRSINHWNLKGRWDVFR